MTALLSNAICFHIYKLLTKNTSLYAKLSRFLANSMQYEETMNKKENNAMCNSTHQNKQHNQIQIISLFI